MHFYLVRAATFRGEGVDIQNAITDSDSGNIIVKTKGTEDAGLFRSTASSSAHRASVDYHLVKTNNQWQITDIVIDGIDINSNPFSISFAS